MKVFVCLFAVIACAHASALSSGTSTSSRTQDSAGNYAFAYNEQHSTGGSSRQESGNGWNVQGSYTLNVGDGRHRVVKYVSDGNGFRAAIATNEPGTAAQPAASTAISSPYAAPVPVQPLPAPVVAAPAPIAVAAPVVAAPALPIASGWNTPALAAPVLPAPAPIVAAPAPILTNGWNSAPVAIAAPVVKAVPSVSSYSTSINHVAPAAAPVLSGWGNAAPALPALPAPALAPIVQAPLNGWN